MEHLRQVWHANRESLFHGIPGPVPLGIANAHLIPISDLAQCELPSNGTLHEHFTMDKNVQEKRELK